MSNEVQVFQSQVPAFLKDLAPFGFDINESISNTIRKASLPKIGIKGSKWRIKDETGEEYVHDRLTLNVIIVGANRNISKVYYGTKYDPTASEAKAPTCYSDNGVGPNPRSESKQCGTCAACPHNVWGSKVNELGNKGRECADFKKLAVILAEDPAKRVYELRLSASAFAGFNAIMAKITATNIPVPAIVFELSFDPAANYPKVVFTPKGYITEAQKQWVETWVNSKEANIAIGYEDLQGDAAVEEAPVIPVEPVPAPAPKPVQPKVVKPIAKAAPAPAEVEAQLAFDLPGVQTAAQATVINPQKSDSTLDDLLAGIMD